MTVCLTAIY